MTYIWQTGDIANGQSPKRLLSSVVLRLGSFQLSIQVVQASALESASFFFPFAVIHIWHSSSPSLHFQVTPQGGLLAVVCKCHLGQKCWVFTKNTWCATLSSVTCTSASNAERWWKEELLMERKNKTFDVGTQPSVHVKVFWLALVSLSLAVTFTQLDHNL